MLSKSIIALIVAGCVVVVTGVIIAVLVLTHKAASPAPSPIPDPDPNPTNPPRHPGALGPLKFKYQGELKYQPAHSEAARDVYFVSSGTVNGGIIVGTRNVNGNSTPVNFFYMDGDRKPHIGSPSTQVIPGLVLGALSATNLLGTFLVLWTSNNIFTYICGEDGPQPYGNTSAQNHAMVTPFKLITDEAQENMYLLSVGTSEITCRAYSPITNNLDNSSVGTVDLPDLGTTITSSSASASDDGYVVFGLVTTHVVESFYSTQFDRNSTTFTEPIAVGAIPDQTFQNIRLYMYKEPTQLIVSLLNARKETTCVLFKIDEFGEWAVTDTVTLKGEAIPGLILVDDFRLLSNVTQASSTVDNQVTRIDPSTHMMIHDTPGNLQGDPAVMPPAAGIVALGYSDFDEGEEPEFVYYMYVVPYNPALMETRIEVYESAT